MSDYRIAAHRGVDIYVTAGGTFVVKQEERFPKGITVSTLEEAKKQIDKGFAIKRPEPVPGILLSSRYSDGEGTFSFVKVTSVSPSDYQGLDVWVSKEKGTRSKENDRDVFPDTPANRKIVEKWSKLRKQVSVLETQVEAELKKLKKFEIPPPPKKLQLKSKKPA